MNRDSHPFKILDFSHINDILTTKVDKYGLLHFVTLNHYYIYYRDKEDQGKFKEIKWLRMKLKNGKGGFKIYVNRGILRIETQSQSDILMTYLFRADTFYNSSKNRWELKDDFNISSLIRNGDYIYSFGKNLD